MHQLTQQHLADRERAWANQSMISQQRATLSSRQSPFLSASNPNPNPNPADVVMRDTSTKWTPIRRPLLDSLREPSRNGNDRDRGERLPSFSVLQHRQQQESLRSRSPDLARMRGLSEQQQRQSQYTSPPTNMFSYSDPSPWSRHSEFAFPGIARQQQQQQPPPRRPESPDLGSSLYSNTSNSSQSNVFMTDVEYMTDDDALARSGQQQHGFSPDIDTPNALAMSGGDTSSNGSTTGPASLSGSGASLREGKRSRYLREMDRRIILARIDRGEKQSALAKEYQVSRSTICNLYKQRHIVLSRTDENPLSRHPKKTRHGAAKHADGTASGNPDASTSDPDGKATAQTSASAVLFNPGVVIEVKSRAAAMLLAVVEHETVRMAHLQRSTDRLMRLLIEEACAVASSAASSPPDPSSSATSSPTPSPATPTEEFAFDHTVQLCAISMEQQGHTMLTAFHEIEPYRPSGYMHFEAMGKGDAVRARLVDANHLPTTLEGLHILLLDTAAHSGSAICATIKKLLEHGADEAKITIVALFVSAEAIALVHYAHPRVCIVTAKVETRWHAMSNGNGNGNNNVDSHSMDGSNGPAA